MAANRNAVIYGDEEDVLPGGGKPVTVMGGDSKATVMGGDKDYIYLTLGICMEISFLGKFGITKTEAKVYLQITRFGYSSMNGFT